MAIQSTLSKAAAQLAETAKKKLVEEIQQKVAPAVEKVEATVIQVSEVLEKIKPVLKPEVVIPEVFIKPPITKPEEPIVLKPEVAIPEVFIKPPITKPEEPIVLKPEEPIVLKPEVAIPEVIIKPPIVKPPILETPTIKPPVIKPPIPPVIDRPPAFFNAFDPQASMLEKLKEKRLGKNREDVNQATPNVSRVSCRKTNFGVKRFTNDLDKNTNMGNVINELLTGLNAPKKN